MQTLVLDGIAKRFQNTEVLGSVSFSVLKGERVVLAGVSGSGKSTLLRIIAGLEKSNAGRVVIDGVDVSGWSANRREVAVVFQDYATYPRLSVGENLSASLVGAGITKAERDSRVREVSQCLELDGFLARLPTELSGGQLQRVALGKAIVARPKLLLLDEPFSQLDVRLCEQLRRLLDECHLRYGMTQIMVSHHPLDALCSADKLALLENGKIIQFDHPDSVRRNPSSRFAAELTSPCGLNILPASLFPQLSASPQSVVAFRPESIRVHLESAVPADRRGELTFLARLGRVRNLGITHLREAIVADRKIWLRSDTDCSQSTQEAAPEAHEVHCNVSVSDAMIFPG